MYPNTPTQQWLEAINPHIFGEEYEYADMRAWIADRDIQAAWRECNRGDWMLMLVGRVGSR